MFTLIYTNDVIVELKSVQQKKRKKVEHIASIQRKRERGRESESKRKVKKKKKSAVK